MRVCMAGVFLNGFVVGHCTLIYSNGRNTFFYSYSDQRIVEAYNGQDVIKVQQQRGG